MVRSYFSFTLGIILNAFFSPVKEFKGLVSDDIYSRLMDYFNLTPETLPSFEQLIRDLNIPKITGNFTFSMYSIHT